VLIAAEVNVVRKRRLWPRAIVQPPLTGGDEGGLQGYAEREERRPEEDVDVRIEDTATFATEGGRSAGERASP
jgi:hypothetical protein